MHRATRRRTRIIVTMVITAGVITAGWCEASEATPSASAKKSHSALVRGQRLDEKGRRPEAIAAYTEAIEDDAGDAAAWSGRGRDYLAGGDEAKALVDLNEALRLQPGDALAFAAR